MNKSDRRIMPRPGPKGSLPGVPQEAARRSGPLSLAVVAAPAPADAASRGPPRGSPPARSGPPGPTLRANPFPEVTDPFCRLPLPTLFRWLEALHLGDLMRLWVRPGGNTIAVPQVFMGRWGASRTPRRLGRPASRPTLSPGEPIPGSSGRVQAFPVKRKRHARGCQGGKRTLLGASTGVPGLPRVAASVRPPPSVRGS